MISVAADIRKLQRSLDDVANRQVPFATAKALTAVADLARVSITRQLPSIFDRPTPFTMRAIAVKPASKATLQATVYVRDIQAGYLRLQETGGPGRPKRSAFVLPVDIGRNAYGNIPRGALQRAKGRKKNAAFVGKVRGIGGFWQRQQDGKVKLLAVFKSQAQYRPRFGFRSRVERLVRSTLPAAFRDELAKALATARR